jgi:hypothetical protein
LLAVLIVLFREFASRLVPAAAMLFFGGWVVLLAAKRFGGSSRWIVRHLPGIPTVVVAALVGQQLVFGGVLTTGWAAGLFFPLAVWLCLRGWRVMNRSRRLTVRAAADIVLSVMLGVVLVLSVVWLANVLSFSPAEVRWIRTTLDQTTVMTKVHWSYWLVAYTLLAVGSYAALRWRDQLARLRQQLMVRLRLTRIGTPRLPVAAAVNFARRFLSGLNIVVMVFLLFVVAFPVVDGTWRKQVANRYELELQQQRELAGASAAYDEIQEYFNSHRTDVVHLRSMVLAVHSTAPAPPGQPATETARRVARQIGRFQAAALDLDDPGLPAPSEPPGTDNLESELDQLNQTQQETSRRMSDVDRFAQLAALAVTRTLQIPDLPENQIVQITSEYLSGLIEDGPVKKIFYAWGKRVGKAPPDTDKFVKPDVRRLAGSSYRATRAAVLRANADLMGFFRQFGFGPRADRGAIGQVVDLANQHRYLHDETGPCSRCVTEGSGGSDSGGRPGRR